MESKRRPGAFIVLEGTDGSGKTSQLELIKQRLVGEGYRVTLFDFPQYSQPSSYFVHRYLQGDYGTIDSVGPYASSLFYALDRYEAAAQIRTALDNGQVVLANRYAASNMAHQGAKFSSPEQRKGYYIWIDNLEYQVLGIPRPDMSFILSMPPEAAMQHVQARGKTARAKNIRDLHEEDSKHQENSVRIYSEMSQLFPKDFILVDCTRAGKVMPLESVHQLLWQKILPFLPPAPRTPKIDNVPEQQSQQAALNTSKAPLFYVPKSLDATMKNEYIQSMEELLANYLQIKNNIASLAYAATAPMKQVAVKSAIQQVAPEACLVLPIAAIGLLEDRASGLQSDAVGRLAAQFLPPTHPETTEDEVKLTGFWPRNEIELVPDILFNYTAVPYKELLQASMELSYAKKADIIKEYSYAWDRTGRKSDSIIEKASYSFEILSDYQTFVDIQKLNMHSSARRQALTPRHGFDTPDLIEQSGSDGLFEKCFTKSLELYSKLQSKGYEEEAQLATLAGHKMRWTISIDARSALQLDNIHKDQQASEALRLIARQMREKISAVHPLLSQ